jgi:hypothetical protein
MTIQSTIDKVNNELINNSLNLIHFKNILSAIEEGVKLGNENTKIGLYCNSISIFQQLLINLFDLQIDLPFAQRISTRITFGSEKIQIIEAENVSVDRKALSSYLSYNTTKGYKKVEISLPYDFLQQLDINIMFTEAYSFLSEEDILFDIVSNDYIIFVSDIFRIFTSDERHFYATYIERFFSKKRTSVAIANAEFIGQEEWKEIVDYTKVFTRKDTHIIPFYGNRKEVSENINQNTIKDLLSSIAKDSYDLRKQKNLDVSKYIIELFYIEIQSYKDNLLGNGKELDEAIKKISANSETIMKNKEAVLKKIDLYLMDYALIICIRKIEEFSVELKKSIIWDINNSSDINNEAKYLNRYLEFVWQQFFTEQDAWLKQIVMNEIQDISKMIKQDLTEFTDSLDDSIKEMILFYMQDNYVTNSHISKKQSKYGVESLSDCINIGSIVLLLFNPLIGLLTFTGSQIMKKLFKGSIIADRKELLVQSVTETLDKMRKQIISQANNQFESITVTMKEEVGKTYEKIFSDISTLLTDKQKEYLSAHKQLEYINNLEIDISVNGKN